MFKMRSSILTTHKVLRTTCNTSSMRSFQTFPRNAAQIRTLCGRKYLDFSSKFMQTTKRSHLKTEAMLSEDRPNNKSKSQPSSSQSGSLDESVLAVGDIVQGRYRVTRELGSGSNGTTYEAELVGLEEEEEKEGNVNGQVVALKALSLKSSRDWKAMELFEREAKVLAQLDHPNIPDYIDYFEVDTPTDRLFYLAQKLAPGKNLQDLVEGGWRVSEEEAVRVVCELLDVLQYLADRRPPVVHRDLKPSNIILDEKTGQVSLVDFGAVAGQISQGQMGSTIVGTYGYMSPEQFRGEATPVSDLYGVGCCLLYLLSGLSPSEFPQSRLKIDVSSVTASARVKGVLERLLEPLAEDRIQSAATAAAILRGEDVEMSSSVSSGSTSLQGRFRAPAGTKVELSREGDDRLVVKLPAQGVTGESLGTGAFALAWNAFTATWTISALTGGGGLLFAAFSAPFWVAGYSLAKQAVEPIFEDARLEITPTKFSINSKGLAEGTAIEGYTLDISNVQIKTEMIVNGEPKTVLQIVEGVRTHNFGSSLTFTEKQWIQKEIKAYLDEAPIIPPPNY